MNVWINLESAEMVVSDEQLKMIESLKNFIIGGGNYGCSEKDFEEERPCDR